MIAEKQPGEGLGERVKAARAKAGLSQDELGKVVGTSREAISQIERGDSRVMRADNLLRIAQTLRVSPNWLVFGTETAANLPDSVEKYRRPRLTWAQAVAAHEAGGKLPMPALADTDMVPAPIETTSSAYWLEAESDACDDVAAVGDLLLVEPEAQPRSGSYVIAIVGGAPVMRRLVVDGGARIAIATGKGWGGLRERLDDDAQILGRVSLVCRRL